MEDLIGSRVSHTPFSVYPTPCAYPMRILLVARGVVIIARKRSSGMSWYAIETYGR